jgi:hypothetical protein
MPSRRTVLTYGLTGAGFLAVGGVGLGLRPGATATPPRPLQVLDARTYAVVAAIAARVTPGSEGVPSAADLEVAANVDELLSTMEADSAWEVVQLLKAFDNALVSAVLGGGFTPFTKLSAPDQDRVLESWRTSSLNVKRLGYKVLRGLTAAAYFGSPAAYAQCGYPGPPDFSGIQDSLDAQAASAEEATP